MKRWPQRVCSLGVPLAFRRKGQQTLVCVTPEGGVMASEWTLLQGRAQPRTRAGVAQTWVSSRAPCGLGHPDRLCLGSLWTGLRAPQPGEREVCLTVSLISSLSLKF